MTAVTWKCSCSVYDDPEQRFTDGACGAYFLTFGGIDYDPFPYGAYIGGEILGWPIARCRDGRWHPEGIEECSISLEHTTIQRFIAQGRLYIDLTTGYLRDSNTKHFPVIEKEVWDNPECNRCGVCCAFPRIKEVGGGACRFLQIEGTNSEEITKCAGKYVKQDKTERFSKDGKFFIGRKKRK